MDILTLINTALSTAKELKKWSDTIQDLEVKLMVSNLLSEIADAKVECATLKSDSIQYTNKINELQKQLTYKEEMAFDELTGCMYKKNDIEKKIPYCPKCLSERALLSNMVGYKRVHASDLHKCVVCEKEVFSSNRV